MLPVTRQHRRKTSNSTTYAPFWNPTGLARLRGERDAGQRRRDEQQQGQSRAHRVQGALAQRLQFSRRRSA
jgi:hypothetical protein